MGQGNTILTLDNIPNYIRVLIAEDLATVHEQWKSSMLKKMCATMVFSQRNNLSCGKAIIVMFSSRKYASKLILPN
jgi:hypothetical protein